MSFPDFFADKEEYRNFDEVVVFIQTRFETKNMWFRVGDKVNTDVENQRALIVLAYAKLMWYTFEQTQALFSEHHHFSLAIPESRKIRNIFQLNQIYVDLLKQWYERNVKIQDFPELIDIPDNVLSLK